jgi:hypothetical protein
MKASFKKSYLPADADNKEVTKLLENTPFLQASLFP